MHFLGKCGHFGFIFTCFCIVGFWWFNSSHKSFKWWLCAKQAKIHSWWRHQMETVSALLAICAGNSPVTVVRSFDVFFDLLLNNRLSKLWRHCNVSESRRPHWLAHICIYSSTSLSGFTVARYLSLYWLPLWQPGSTANNRGHMGHGPATLGLQ